MVLLPADTVLIYNTAKIDNKEKNILMKLYQPIIGSSAVNFFLTLESLTQSSEIIKKNHHFIMSFLHTSLSEIEVSREKLEAVGLMRTYKNDFEYIYELIEPVTSHEFFENPILSTLLENSIGKKECEDLIDEYIGKKINLDEYKEITKKFDDVFKLNNTDNHIITETPNKKAEITVNEKTKIDQILNNIPEELLPRVPLKTREYLQKLSYIYDINQEVMKDLIIDSVNHQKIDIQLLKGKLENFYKFQNNGKLPNAAYISNGDTGEIPTDISKFAKMAYVFKNTPPKDYLSFKNGNIKLTKSDRDLLNYLLVDLDLNPGVTNVLIDYVLKVNNNKLIKNYIEKIALQWKRSNLVTVEEAMEFAQAQKKQTRGRVKTKETVPDWVETKTKPIEDQKKREELEKILNEFN